MADPSGCTSGVNPDLPLASARFQATNCTVFSKSVAADENCEIRDAQVIDLNGGPCRDRTYDQLIKRNAAFLVNHCNSCVSFEHSVED